MYEGKEEIHEYMQYEVSMTVYMGRTTNESMKNGCHLKTRSQNHDNDDNDANANDDGQSMIQKGSLVDKPNEPKSIATAENYITGTGTSNYELYLWIKFYYCIVS